MALQGGRRGGAGGGAAALEGQLELDRAPVLDLEPRQARHLQPVVVQADLHAARHLDGRAVPAGLDGKHDLAGDAVQGQVPGQPQAEHLPAGGRADGERAGQAEAGRRVAVKLQPAVTHRLVAGLLVGAELAHVHRDLGGGDAGRRRW